MGNIGYLLVSFFTMYTSGSKLFRYFDATDYDNGSVLGTNYWLQMARMSLYTRFFVFFTLFMTQAASMAGYYTDINVISWSLLLFAEFAMTLFIYVMRIYIWNKGYSISQDSKESVADRALGLLVHDAVELEMKDMMYEYTATHFPLYALHKHWEYAQKYQLANMQEEGEDGENEEDSVDPIEEALMTMPSFFFNI